MNSTLISTTWGPWILAALELVLVGSVVGLALKTSLLRDSDPAQPNYALRAFSMGKSQLAFWMVVIIGCFLYVYFALDAFNGVLNKTAFYLLGISSATAALAAAANSPKPGSPGTNVPPLPAIPVVIVPPVVVPPNNPPAVPVIVPPPPPPAPAPAQPHVSFLSDILSDREGMNIHRLQMLIWTVVFGGLFVREVIKNNGHSFPEFDDQIYGLMGISSVTYVWFKRGET